MRIIHVLRKPFSGSVAKNVLEHGTAGLNIDACRVVSGEVRPVIEYFYKDGEAKKGKQPTGMVYQGRADGTLADSSRVIGETTTGRWPPNVILEHLPGCRKVGTKQVSGSYSEGGGARPGGFGDVGAAKGGSVPVGRGYAGPDGTEAVDEWECVAGCPVADLDGHTGLYLSDHGSYDEGGGASRFFKQFGGDRQEE